MNLRKATTSDFEAIWPIFQSVISTGATYNFAPDTDYQTAFDYWFSQSATAYVAEENGNIVGTYKLMTYQRDQGSCVANAAFMVDPDCSGRGIGKALGLHCLKEAKKAGYKAILFYYVVSTNESAIALWKKLGFIVVGTVPEAFLHPKKGFVDVFLMHRFLDDIEC